MRGAKAPAAGKGRKVRRKPWKESDKATRIGVDKVGSGYNE